MRLDLNRKFQRALTSNKMPFFHTVTSNCGGVCGHRRSVIGTDSPLKAWGSSFEILKCGKMPLQEGNKSNQRLKGSCEFEQGRFQLLRERMREKVVGHE